MLNIYIYILWVIISTISLSNNQYIYKYIFIYTIQYNYDIHDTVCSIIYKDTPLLYIYIYPWTWTMVKSPWRFGTHWGLYIIAHLVDDTPAVSQYEWFMVQNAWHELSATGNWASNFLCSGLPCSRMWRMTWIRHNLRIYTWRITPLRKWFITLI
jgi:hypothetical protein